MAGTDKTLGQIQLGVALTDVYVVPTGAGNVSAKISTIWICNTDSAARTVTLRSGAGALAANNSLLEAASIPANTTWEIDAAGLVSLLSGQKIQGLSDVAAKITITIFGTETI